MPSTHREVEVKFDLDEETALPDLTTLPGVSSASAEQQTLAATYFDTDDLTLAAAGVTVRRRTGGADAGWHLKLPAGAGRLEVQLPLGRATKTAPKQLRSIVFGVVRDRPLVQVAVIRTERYVVRLHDRTGGVLAEVADDRVSAERPSDEDAGVVTMAWREVEVELVEGDERFLKRSTKVLAAAGATRSPSPSKLSRVLGDRLPDQADDAWSVLRKQGAVADVVQRRLLEQVSALHRLDPLVRHDVPGSVHDMRVAVRRIRSAAASYGPFVDRVVTEPLRKELAWLADSLGEVRDVEELRKQLVRMLDTQIAVAERAEPRRWVEHELSLCYARARTHLLSVMVSARYLTLLDGLDNFAREPAWTDAATSPARDALPKRLRRDWRRLSKRVEAAIEDFHGVADVRDRRLHNARKAAKRVRYAAEPLIGVYGRRAKKIVKSQKRIQSLLGHQHDSVVAQQQLRLLAEKFSAAGGNSFVFGVLHAYAERAAVERAEAFVVEWQRVERSASRNSVTQV
jgi:CHAD domain-containing protein